MGQPRPHRNEPALRREARRKDSQGATDGEADHERGGGPADADLEGEGLPRKIMRAEERQRRNKAELETLEHASKHPCWRVSLRTTTARPSSTGLQYTVTRQAGRVKVDYDAMREDGVYDTYVTEGEPTFAMRKKFTEEE